VYFKITETEFRLSVTNISYFWLYAYLIWQRTGLGIFSDMAIR